ncbi:hypothetical protein ACG7TL_008147 [Trametes sanguinea]
MSSLSYPALEEPAVDSAEASSHFGAVGRLIGRSSSKRSTTSLSRSGSKGEKDAEAGDKRKSRLADIPLLETHLLPSLRDTVDRMTQLPRPSDEPPAAGSSHSRPPSTISSSRTFNASADSPASTNIPRLRSKPSPAPKPRVTRKDYLIPTESGLELERQVGRKHSPGRLVVTNATIVPSSSESDRGAKKNSRTAETPKRDAPSWFTPDNPGPVSEVKSQAWARRSTFVPSSTSRKPAAVGLGLNVDAGFAGAQSRFAIDEESVYEHDSDAQSLLLDEPVLIPPSDIDDESIYEAEPAAREDTTGYSALWMDCTATISTHLRVMMLLMSRKARVMEDSADIKEARRYSVDSASLYSRSSPQTEYEDSTLPVSEHEYEDAPVSPPQVVVHEASSSWRSTLSDDVYLSLSRHYGPVEMERQELIFSLYASEQSFAKSARCVVRNVLLPLRARDSRAWLPGLPPDITRFFDWLEDVVNLHSSIAHALSSVTAIWQTGSIVQRLAATLKGFVPRFEVYMPYLVKYESMREALKWHAEQDDGEFGEYLRLQERDRQEGTWSLDKLFEEPALRLRSYLDSFQRLGELTPREHPDHLVTLSLLYSTRTAVRVMEEVKTREEEYDFVKELSARIDGLSNAPPLARRARRLLWYGTLVLTFPSLDNHLQVSAPAITPNATPTLPNGSLSPRTNGRPPQKAHDRSKLATAIRDWTTRRSRAGSLSSSASSMRSMQTYDTASSASSASILITPRSDQFPGIQVSARAGAKGHLQSPQIRPQVPPPPRETLLNVMVFSDLVVLAAPIPQKNGKSQREEEQEQRSRLLDSIGLSRILDITEAGERCVNLSLVPIPPGQLDTGITVENTSPTFITLTHPASESPASSPTELFKALRKCHHHTVRGLSYPSLPAVITDDLELDTRQSLVGILSSGLPLPKSPSMQFGDAAQDGGGQDSAGGEDAATRGEREERGWWTLRFQQVLREMQREDVPVALAGEWAQRSAAL